MNKIVLSLVASLTLPAFAQKAGVKISDIPTNEDTSIVIKKGDASALNPPDYEIVEGKDELAGDPMGSRKEAFTSWKTACSEWKSSLKEMNKDSQILTLNCGSAVDSKEEYLHIAKSHASYKMKVRIRDSKK